MKTLKQRIKNCAKLVYGFNINFPLPPILQDNSVSENNPFVNGYSKYGSAFIPGAVAVSIVNGTGHILVNEAFHSLTEETKLTVLDHEKGHLKFPNESTSLESELKADSYAIEEGRDVFKMLVELASYCPIFLLSKEYNTRLEYSFNTQSFIDKNSVKELAVLRKQAKVIKTLALFSVLKLFR